MGPIRIALRHPALEQPGKTTDGSQRIPDLVGHPQRHVVEYFDPLCEYKLVFQVFSGCNVKDEAVEQLYTIVVENWNCVVNYVPHRLISVDDLVLHIETTTPFQVAFSVKLDSLLIFRVNMSHPEKMVFLDFLIRVAKCLETIRADVECTQLMVQGVGNKGSVFEEAMVTVDTIFQPSGSLKIGSTVEVGSCDWGGSHQTHPGLWIQIDLRPH